ncbi:MAG: YfiR family protein [Pyrinomonadaceae bacterium]
MTVYQIGPLGPRRSRQILRGVMLVSLLALMGNMSITQVHAQADEYQVKAAFIFNFAKFVDWPSNAFGDGDTLVVGVVGDDPFDGALDRLNGNMANGRRLRIKRLRVGDNLRACQILFISNSEGRNLGKSMDSSRGSSVLTIAEMPQFNQSGGIIRFVIQKNKVRFEINAQAAGQSRLRISSKLMALSKGGN